MFWTNFTINVLLFIYVIDCVFMGLVIMMQRSKQEGLGAAFGGGITESVWGAQTSQVLVKGTVWAALLFFVLSISLARLYSYRSTRMDQPSTIQQQLLALPGAKTTILPNTPTNSAGAAVVPTSTPLSPTTNATIFAPSPAKSK